METGRPGRTTPGPEQPPTKRSVLLKELRRNAKWFDTQSKSHKKWHRRYRVAIFVLTALSSVLASAAVVFPDVQTYLNLSIVVLTASMGVITSYDGLRKFGDLWITERIMCNQLRDTRRAVEYYTLASCKDEDLDKYFERLQEIMAESDERWVKHVQATQGKTPPSP